MWKKYFSPIESLDNKFANKFLEKWKKMDLVELYRKSHRQTGDIKNINGKSLKFKRIKCIADYIKKDIYYGRIRNRKF